MGLELNQWLWSKIHWFRINPWVWCKIIGSGVKSMGISGFKSMGTSGVNSIC